MERVIKHLPVSLTREEIEERSKTVARLSGEIADAERKVESEKESAKARVKEAEAIAEGLSAKQRQLSRVVLEGREEREVACTVRLDRANRQKITTRDDTGERVDVRPLTDGEMREGAAWKVDLGLNRAELIHPDEPDIVLDVRPLTDEERQGELPVGGKKSSKAKPAAAEESPL